MLNLLRMDMRRLIGNKVTIALLLIYCLFHVFGIFMMNQYPSAPVNGLTLAEMNEWQFLQHTLALAPSWALIYLSVFTVYFYMSEYNAGFYKNYISMRRARLYSVLSKLSVQGVFTLALMAAVVFSDVVGRYWFFENSTFGDTGRSCVYWAFNSCCIGPSRHLYWLW